MTAGIFMPAINGISYDDPGSIVLDITGTHNFSVPNFSNELIVELWGAGAGGEGAGINNSAPDGVNGGNSSCAPLSLTAGGGLNNGTGGTASGGDVIANGGNRSGRNGGGGANGGAGGVSSGSGSSSGASGTAPGGGGSGGRYIWDDNGVTRATTGNGGGGGAYVKKSYARGAISPGLIISLTVGAGGNGGSSQRSGGAGARGEIRISWT